MSGLYRDKNLQVMFIVTLMVVLGVSSLMPALPVIMKELNVGLESIGLTFTMFTLPGIFLMPIVGVLADRLGRKRILIAALVIFGIFGTGCAFVNDFRTLLAFRFFQGFGVATLSLLNVTIIGDLFSAKDRPEALGYTTLVLSFGAAVFPVLGGYLGEFGWNYPFALAALAIPAAYLVHVRLDNPEPTQSVNLGDYARGVAKVALTKQAMALFLITLCTLMILYGPIASYMPVLLNERFNASPLVTGLILSISSLFTGLSSAFVGRINNVLGVMAILKLAACLYVAAFISVPQIYDLWILIGPVALVGAAMGLNAPSRITMLTGLAPADQRAAIMSINGVFQRLGQTVSPVLMGLIASNLSLDWIFFTAAILSSIMLGLVFLLKE